MLVDDIYYQVDFVSGIWDGRGFEKVILTQSGGSLAGCNDCNFPGFTFANTVSYSFASIYAPIGDCRRLEELDNSVPNHHTKYNLLYDTQLPPVNRTYDDYIRDGHTLSIGLTKKYYQSTVLKGYGLSMTYLTVHIFSNANEYYSRVN